MVDKERKESQNITAVTAVSTKHVLKPFTCQLSDDSSTFTAEPRAILLALKHVYCSKEKSFLILSYSLLSLQVMYNLSYNLSTDFKTMYGIDQRWEGDCFYLGPWPFGH